MAEKVSQLSRKFFRVFRNMCTIKFDHFVLLVLLSAVEGAIDEFWCDEYVHVDQNSQFFVISGYELPATKYSRRLNQSVPCPCSPAQPCLRKCCLGDDVFRLSTKKCLQSAGEDHKFESGNWPQMPPGDYSLIYGSFCPSLGRSSQGLSFLEDGSVQLHDRHIPLQRYCVEYFEEEREVGLLECKEEAPAGNSAQKLFTCCLAVSIVCLCVTLLVYSCIRKLRNLPGRILLCYVSSFLATETCLFVMQFISVAHGHFCIAAAYLFQFSFSATFFWLNVMCFDLWLTFRGHRFPKQPHGPDGKSKKFTIYCLYAWGVPLIISTITMLIELSIIPGEFVKPEIGQNSCWFRTHEATFWYLYSYTSVLLLLNLYMFLTTLLNLFKSEKIGKIFKKDGSKRHKEQEKQRFFLYLKLFLIMGIGWIMDGLSYYFRNLESLKYVWFLTDLTSTLQGVLILLIFVFNKKVLGSLNEKWCPNKNLVRRGTNITRKSSCSVTTTTCSQRGHTQSTMDVEMGNSLPK